LQGDDRENEADGGQEQGGNRDGNCGKHRVFLGADDRAVSRYDEAAPILLILPEASEAFAVSGRLGRGARADSGAAVDGSPPARYT
jgi:hypothetical protein